jgi:hypothetical protein
MFLCDFQQQFTFMGPGLGGNTFTAMLTLTSDNDTAVITQSPQSPHFATQSAVVAEPVTLMLLGAGLAGLALSRRRRSR